MKLFKLILLIIILLNFNTCKTTQLRNMHKEEIQAELSRFSDFLDLRRTEIEFSGRRYYFRGSAPTLGLLLYVKPIHNNSETLFTIRDELMEFFGNNTWEAGRGRYPFPDRIVIIFTLGESGTFYSVTYIFDEWYEHWHSERQETIIGERFDIEDFGKPLIGKTIINEELDKLLHNYINRLEIEQYYGFHSGTDRIKMWLIIPGDFRRETVLEIRDDLIVFFENNKNELVEEYAQFNTIYITIFSRADSGGFRYVYTMNQENNEWENRWSWGFSEHNN